MPEIRAEIRYGESQWTVTWRSEATTPEYRVSQLAFEAKRAAERSEGH